MGVFYSDYSNGIVIKKKSKKLSIPYLIKIENSR
jgi:hypothetical protein